MKNVFAVVFALYAIASFSSVSLAFEIKTSTEAYEEMLVNPNAYILDVRTLDEWEWVGHPGPNKLSEGLELKDRVFHVPYQHYIKLKGASKPTYELNRSFANEVAVLFPNKDVRLFIMCRSGGRSKSAAELLEGENYGYTNIVNISDGFEGGADTRGYRILYGWKNNGLPHTFGRIGGYGD